MLDPVQRVRRLCDAYDKKELTTIESTESTLTSRNCYLKHKLWKTERPDDM
jgi:hypothetical protein